MIRQYNGRPRFDGGFDPEYNQDILNQAIQMYDQQRAVNNLSMNDIDAMNDYTPRPKFMDIDPSSLIQPEVKKRYSGTTSSQRTRRATTGAEDMKTAQKQYNAAASAARKKQAAENKQAVQTLKDNGVISKGTKRKTGGMSQQDVWNAFEKGAVAKGNLRKAYYSNRAHQLKSQLARQKRLADNERLHQGSRYHQNKYNDMLRLYNHLTMSQKGVKPKRTITKSPLERLFDWASRKTSNSPATRAARRRYSGYAI